MLMLMLQLPAEQSTGPSARRTIAAAHVRNQRIGRQAVDEGSDPAGQGASGLHVQMTTHATHCNQTRFKGRIDV